MKVQRLLGLIKECLLSESNVEDMFSDAIDRYIELGDKEKEREYKKRYKEKFGKEYKPKIDPNVKLEVTLNKIYTLKDFQTYKMYDDYCQKLFKLRFSKYKNELKGLRRGYIKISDLVKLLSEIGIKVTVGKVASKTADANVEFSGTKEIILNSRKYKETGDISKEIIIHEMGHLLDNKLNYASNSDLFLPHNASSVYSLNPCEVYAEHFLNYCVSPKYLQKGWKDIYQYFRKVVPSDWGKLIEKIKNQ